MGGSLRPWLAAFVLTFGLGVVAHELVHTLQVDRLVVRIEAVRRRYPKVPRQLYDHIVQDRFGKNPPCSA